MVDQSSLVLSSIIIFHLFSTNLFLYSLMFGSFESASHHHSKLIEGHSLLWECIGDEWDWLEQVSGPIHFESAIIRFVISKR